MVMYYPCHLDQDGLFRDHSIRDQWRLGRFKSSNHEKLEPSYSTDIHRQAFPACPKEK